MKNAIILAGGMGTRMQSQLPKVMHELLGKPMIKHIVDNLHLVGVNSIVTVINDTSESIQKTLGNSVEYAIQEEPLGTIDALRKVHQLASSDGTTLILNGDYGLIQPETIQYIFENHQGHDMTIITAKPKEAGTARRVIRDNQGNIEKIVEFNPEDRSLVNQNEITMGVYCINNSLLYHYLPKLQTQAKQGANLMGLVEVLKVNGHSIQGLHVTQYRDMQGINDRKQLVEANIWLQEHINNRLITQGVTIYDPKSTYIGPDVTFEGEAVVYPNNHLYGSTVIGNGAILYPNNFIVDGKIGAQTTVDSSRVTDSSIGANATVGPFAHIRMHSQIGSNTRIGNFVEIKNVEFGNKSKSAHLTYLGDALVGENVNVGCGVVTANYDGKSKHRTTIGDGTFIGSNTTIVAPVTLGNDVLTAAGSVINEDVETGAMAIARSRQVNKPNLGKKFKNKD